MRVPFEKMSEVSLFLIMGILRKSGQYSYIDLILLIFSTADFSPNEVISMSFSGNAIPYQRI